MNTRNKQISSETKLLYIGGVGFMFEVNPSLKHNLITPDILAFFDGVPESGEVTKDCAFPLAISGTNIQLSLFQKFGYDWVVCYDGVFRKCQMVKSYIEYNGSIKTIVFYVDSSIVGHDIAGIITKYE